MKLFNWLFGRAEINRLNDCLDTSYELIKRLEVNDSELDDLRLKVKCLKMYIEDDEAIKAVLNLMEAIKEVKKDTENNRKYRIDSRPVVCLPSSPRLLADQFTLYDRGIQGSLAAAQQRAAMGQGVNYGLSSLY